MTNMFMTYEEEKAFDRRIGLEEIISLGQPIFLDNNILAQVRSAAIGNNKNKSAKFVQRTYKCQSLRDFPKRILLRARRYSEDLLKNVKEYDLFFSSPAILLEYKQVVDHYRNVFEYFGGHRSENKKVMQELEKLATVSRELYKILNLRNNQISDKEYECVDDLTSRIKKRKMHISSDGWYQKKAQMVENDTAEEDAQLVASAIICAMQRNEKKAIVLSADMDVINIVRNVNPQIGEIRISAYIPELSAPVNERLYMPIIYQLPL
jgi:hypothetical protein